MNRQILVAVVLVVSIFIQSVEGKRKMDTITGLIKFTIPYKNLVLSIFPLPEERTFGLIAGRNEDVATVRIVSVTNDRFNEDEVPLSEYEAGSQRGEKASDSPQLFLIGNRIITILDIEKKKKMTSYWGVGNTMENTYAKAKVIDFRKQLVLTLFDPLYDADFKKIINSTCVLTIENVAENRRIKQLPVNTLSGRYKIEDEIAPTPALFFGTTFTVYRESSSYDWLCVNNNLDPIEHPLCSILNDNKPLFYSETFLLLDMAICEQKKFAALIFRKEQKTRILIIAWDRKQPLIPVPIEFTPPVTPDFTNFTLSPSGEWLYFEGTSGVHEDYCGSYLVRLDPALPNIALPPIKIDLVDSPQRLTWMTSPEGLIVYSEKAFHYWDLSKFDPGTFVGK